MLIINNCFISTEKAQQRSSAGDIQKVATEEQNLSIPEEVPVVMSSSPYQPVDSPVKEDLPPLPGDKTDGSPDKLDLDTQIQELTKELEMEKCKAEISGGIGDAPSPPQGDPTKENHVQEKNAQNTQEKRPEAAPLLEENPEDAKAKSKGSRSCLRALLISLFISFILFWILAFLVLETEVAAPVVSDIREMPEVQDFKSNHYDPFKTSVSSQVGGWFKQ